MATKRPPPPLAYRLRTAVMITEYKGGHAEGIEMLFVALPDALARRKMLDRLEKSHLKMLANGAGPDVEQSTAAQVATLGGQVHPDSALPSFSVRYASSEPDPICICGAAKSQHPYMRCASFEAK